MKTLFVSDIVIGTVLSGVPFAISEKKQGTDKNGANFFDLTLSDKTGEIKAKIWPDALVRIDTKLISTGKVLSFSGVAVEFKENVQLNIHDVGQVDETKLDEYVQASTFSAENLWSKLTIITDKIQNPHLKSFLDNMWADSELLRKFKYWPAGNSYHHNFRSGLLQHVLECLQLAEGVDDFYPALDMDIVRVGIIVHDIGKLEEIDADSITPKYSLVGSVLGHVYLGTQYVDKYMPAAAPQKLNWHLKHIILSHHGSKEHGSPMLPATPEALLVASCDHASFHLNMGMKAIQDQAAGTEYSKHLDRWMWSGANSISE